MKNHTLNCELQYITHKDDIWFRGKTVAIALGYANGKTDKGYAKAIRKYVDDDDKDKLGDVSNGFILDTLTYNEKNTIMINESGLYSLIMSSKLPTAKVFKRWVTKDVLPSIRKNGQYVAPLHDVRDVLTFKIETEADLQCKVVNFMKNQYPDSLFIATLGETQDTAHKRITSKKMGYLKGSPDLLITNLHKHYTGFVIEFKTPKGTGWLSDSQKQMLSKYKNNGYKTLVTNSYDEAIVALVDYFKDTRIACQYCTGKFKSETTLANHEKHFHKIGFIASSDDDSDEGVMMEDSDSDEGVMVEDSDSDEGVMVEDSCSDDSASVDSDDELIEM